jgi:hypothetical protein
MFNEKEMKIWRLALDKSAIDGEWKNSAVAILTLLRSRNFRYEDLMSGRVNTPPTDWGSTVMDFGKQWKGEMIKNIDPQYLSWFLGWVEEEEWRQEKYKFLVIAINRYFGV